MIPFANVLQPLIDVFDWLLVHIHDVIPSWGLSIIALTVIVRLAMTPLTVKQFRSMQALQKLAPQIKAMQEKYKDDRQRLNQEMMKFYQENKVNPFGSCLPLVLQLPVFISLFYLLRKDLKHDICPGIGAYAKAHGTTVTHVTCNQVDPGSAKFLFIPDLTARSTGWVLIVLLVLYVGSQLLSSVLMSVTADRNQRLLMVALPFVFIPFVQSFPAGLMVYWITTNLWTVGQQTLLRRSAGMPIGIRSQPQLAAAAAASSSKSRPTDSPKARPTDSPKADKADASADGRSEAPRAAPPPPPRKKKKQRSGRRR
jgi:YidC/Oxa1 family membrane protein insertase